MELTGFYEYQCLGCGKFYPVERWKRWAYTGAIRNGGGRWCSYACYLHDTQQQKPLGWRPGREESYER